MKIEIIMLAIVLTVFGIGGYVYVTSPKDSVSNGIIVNKDKIANPVFLTEEKKRKELIVAPDISSPDGFINTEGKPITLAELKGKKVVLLDIWTYSCINCQRTIPTLNKLYEKYKDQGLEIVGLHTPEFAFERVQKNVEAAVKRFGIKYPVVLDNDFSTWNAYENRYWPRKYLIDIDGYIVYDHAGEGAYDETESAIQKALLERSVRLSVPIDTSFWKTNMAGEKAIKASVVGSPEIYFGSARNEYLENGKSGVSGNQALAIPESIRLNKLYLGGSWFIDSEFSENKGAGEIAFKYKAKNVYMVASGGVGTEVSVFRDGIFFKSLLIKGEELYPIIESAESGEHTLLIKIPAGGTLKAFTFTFG